MKAFQVEDAPIKRPIVIAAMQDMGNVGSIAIDFVNKSLQTSLSAVFQSLFQITSLTTAAISTFTRIGGSAATALTAQWWSLAAA